MVFIKDKFAALVASPSQRAAPAAPSTSKRAMAQAALNEVNAKLASLQGWGPEVRTQRVTLQAQQRLLMGALAPPVKAKPSAEYTTLSPQQQQQVRVSVQGALRDSLEGRVPPEKQAAVTDLVRHLGRPDFYERMAVHQPQDAAKWKEMAKVQKQFGEAEAGYDATTRAYSESMRLTLHASAVQHLGLEGQSPTKPLYERFIELHPTAFHQNGGWVDNLQIPLSGARDVAVATPVAMVLNAADLVQGSFRTDPHTVRAAQMVREARRSVAAGE